MMVWVILGPFEGLKAKWRRPVSGEKALLVQAAYGVDIFVAGGKVLAKSCTISRIAAWVDFAC